MVCLAAAILLGHALLVSATCPAEAGDAEPAQLETIQVWAGALIDKIVFAYADGSERVFGDSGGGYRGSFRLQRDEHLVSITGKQGDTLHFVQFHTSLGRSSQVFSGAMPSKEAFVKVAPPGHHIVGFNRDPSHSAYGCCGVITALHSEPEDTQVELRNIQVWGGLLIDQVAFTFTDGNRSEFGRAGGSYMGDFALLQDESLTRITGYQGNSLFTVQFHTSLNRSSQLFGRQANPDIDFDQAAPPGHEITGLVRYGSCGPISQLRTQPLVSCTTATTTTATVEPTTTPLTEVAHDLTTTATPTATAPVAAAYGQHPVPVQRGNAALPIAAAVLAALVLRRSGGKGSGDDTGVADSCTSEGTSDAERGIQHSDDPAFGAVTLEQLNDLRKRAKQELGDDFASATMYDINDRIVRPLCSKHRKSYAHIVNGSEPKHVDVFVSHAWAENFDEFVKSVNAPFLHWRVKPTFWICALALIQSTDPAVIASQVGTGDDPLSAPFSKALSKADKVLVVRNNAVNLYDRIWCCWELFVAHRLSLVDKPGGLIVTGPCRSHTDHRIDIAAAKAFNLEDKRRILSHVLSAQTEYQAINDLLTEIWHAKLEVDAEQEM